ncbi:hypothetical protein HZB03_02615 [Candidatus Woesearchaeota archaeon]|nr:hypothetical protein [Candidatus Woesearchaeota archaeon]
MAKQRKKTKKRKPVREKSHGTRNVQPQTLVEQPDKQMHEPGHKKKRQFLAHGPLRHANLFKAAHVTFWSYLFIFAIYLTLSSVVTIDLKLASAANIAFHVLIAAASGWTAMLLSRKLLSAWNTPAYAITLNTLGALVTRRQQTSITTALLVLTALLHALYIAGSGSYYIMFPFIVPLFLYANLTFALTPPELAAGPLSFLPSFFSLVPIILQVAYLALIARIVMNIYSKR